MTYTEARDRASEAYKDEDFKNNPDGYTIAPYVNAETTAIAFEAGSDWGSKYVLESAEVKGLVGAAKDALMTCRKTTTGPMRINMIKVEELEAALAAFEKWAKEVKGE